MRKVSGVYSRASRTLGCESCNFMEKYIKSKGLKTGDVCPVCEKETLRVFDSKAEATRNIQLQLLLRAGEIVDLEYQKPFDLDVFCKLTNETVKIGKYVSDYCYFLVDNSEEDGLSLVVEDVKGKVYTDIFEMKRKHFEAQYNLKIKIVSM